MHPVLPVAPFSSRVPSRFGRRVRCTSNPSPCCFAFFDFERFGGMIKSLLPTTFP
ncbi:hypothetical protein B0H11DRAFT_2245766 [Mycena galericulata]|nr:hypothetical protein B0H11DRAFT_2245766 [Mycena galericulata]